MSQKLGAFGKGQGVVDVHSEIADGAFDLRVPKQDLDSPQVAFALVRVFA